MLFLRRVRFGIVWLILRFKKFKLSSSIVILGEARSGTTWLMELLGQMPQSVIHWEPMNMRLGVLKGRYNFGRRAYIPSQNTEHAYLRLFEEMLTMKRISPWSTRFCKINKIFTANIVVTKFVKASLTLPWIVEHLSLQYKPILILRHPIATAYSQIKTFNKDNVDLKPFKVPDVLFNERYMAHARFINKLDTHLQRHIALWCLNTVPILKHPQHGKDWIVVYYEHLLEDPTNEMENLGKLLNIRMPINNIAFRKASQMTVDQFYKSDPNKQLEKWRQKIKSDELIAIQRIFEYFELDLYTTKELYPIKTSKVFI